MQPIVTPAADFIGPFPVRIIFGVESYEVPTSALGRINKTAD